MNNVPNSIVLMFVRGWQGGTIRQIAAELGVTPIEIERADMGRMGELMRLAQQRQRDETKRYYAIDVVRFSPVGPLPANMTDEKYRYVVENSYRCSEEPKDVLTAHPVTVGYSGTGHFTVDVDDVPEYWPVDR